MADVAASILAPVVESSLKSIGAIIKRQFIYLFCFTRNIKGLEDEAKSLNDQVHGVKVRVVDEVTNNAREIHPQVTTWLQKSDEFIEEESAILKEVPNVTGGCLRFAARFSLSRRAKKTTEAMAQHRQNSNFENMSLPPPAPATKESLLGKTFSFDSRKKIEQDIMNTLRDKKGTTIAIHGMGGLGKTTMAKRIMNALLNERVFDEVVIAAVSQQVDELKIQLDIGGQLGLKDLKDEASQEARSQLLHARLSVGTKRTLLVLDDVWQKLVLEKLGIPWACEGCTILITSRNSDALRAMNVEFVFEMKQLFEEEAWFMFREIVGACVDDKELLAKEVMRECRGLPIALEALGAALKDEKSEGVWKDNLSRLRKPNPRNTPDYIAEVYNPLILSYDKLDEEFKTPFLLCCLFREDVNIPVEFLTCFCMGLRLFDDLESLGEVRDRMCSLVKMLKSRSLLLDGDDEDHVRLHDVVRDVCIFIAKQKKYIGGNDCTWISNSQLPDARFVNLRLLFSDDKQFEIDDTYFEGMRELCVLSFIRYLWTSLPLTIQSLNHLRTLILYWCYNLETISVIGTLVHLEILICRSCGSIKELPEEMKGPKHLKLLELNGCINLRSIGRGIISSLVELEELKILNSFNGWDAAHLREVGELTKLRFLEIEIADEALIAEDINLSSKLEQFHIIFGDSHINYPKSFNKQMWLRLDGGGRLGHWIRKLLKDTECLDVEGDGAADIQNYISNIQWLNMRECGGIKSIATTSGVLLEHLDLRILPQLEEIWNGPANSLTFLQNLKEIKLWHLPALKHLWKSNTNIVSLPQLKTLVIENCEMMEHLFVWSEEDVNEISNRGSPNATQIQGVKFPLLWKMKIIGCPKMRSITCTSKTTDIDDHSWHLFCQPEKVSFVCLEELEIDWNPFCRHHHIYVSFNEIKIMSISRYHGSLSLFTATVARNLVNLKELEFNDCDEMVAVIEDDNEEGIRVSDGECNRPFPNLQILRLKILRKLVRFCNSKSDAELPSVKRLDISKCRNMTTNLSLAPLALDYLGNLKEIELKYLPALKHLWKSNTNIVSLPQLEILQIEDCEMMEQLFVWSEEDENEITNKGSPNRDVIKIHFPQLRKMEIGNCPKMRSIISTTSLNGDGSNNKTDIDDHSSHLVSLPHLEILEISNCEMMEHLFVWSEEGENEITNRRSPNATQIQGVKFPNLWKMKITKCPKMRSITGTSKTDIDDHSSHLFCQPEKVSFGRLKELEIDWNPFCHHHHISASFFNEIEKLSISKYHGSLSLFTATVARNLVNLKELEFNRCDEMVAVIEDDNEEGIIVSDGECNRPFHNLQILRLYNLQKLVRFCNSKSDAELPSVKRLDISECRNMTTNLSLAPLSLDYLGNLKEIILWCLPALKYLWKSNTNIVSLPQLEILVINDCEMMEQLFVWSEEDENEITNRGSPNRDVIQIQFPQLRKMKIMKCPKMRSIMISTTSLNGDGSNNKTGIDDHSSHLVSLPHLEILEISNCKMMEHLFVWSEEGENEITNRRSPNATQIQGVKFPYLWKMKITKCPKMRSITGTSKTTDIDDHSSHLFCQPEKVSFGRLKELETEWNSFCHHIHIHASFFNGMKKLSIHKYHGNLSLFTATITRNLINLKELRISDCDEMVAVIEDDKEEGITLSDGECIRPFPNLQILQLERLRKLVSFCNSKSNVELPSLKRLDISRCPNTTTNLSLAPLALEEVRTDLDCYLGILFKETGNYPSCSLHETRIFPFVNGLQRLHIHKYEGSMSIFSSLIAENLINLRELEISFCDEIVKVIEGGERSGTLLFPKLQKLELFMLPKLEIFCEWKSNVELPLLKDLSIVYCQSMTKFSLGSVTTPCLDFVRIEWHKKYRIDGTTDLNGALKQHFAKEKGITRITNEDDGGDENKDIEGHASNGDGDVEIEKGTNEASEREDEQSTSYDEKMDQINE